MPRPKRSGFATNICFCSNCISISPAGVVLPIAEFQLHGLLEKTTCFAPLANVAPPVSIEQYAFQAASIAEAAPPIDVAPLVSAFSDLRVDEIVPLVNAFSDLTLDTPLFSQPVIKIGGTRCSRKGFTDKASAVVRRIRDEALDLSKHVEDVSRLNWALEDVVRIENRLDTMEIALYKFRRGEDPVVALRSEVDNIIETLRERCKTLRSGLPLVEETRPFDFCSGMCSTRAEYNLANHFDRRTHWLASRPTQCYCPSLYIDRCDMHRLHGRQSPCWECRDGNASNLGLILLYSARSRVFEGLRVKRHPYHRPDTKDHLYRYRKVQFARKAYILRCMHNVQLHPQANLSTNRQGSKMRHLP